MNTSLEGEGSHSLNTPTSSECVFQVVLNHSWLRVLDPLNVRKESYHVKFKTASVRLGSTDRNLEVTIWKKKLKTFEPDSVRWWLKDMVCNLGKRFNWDTLQYLSWSNECGYWKAAVIVLLGRALDLSLFRGTGAVNVFLAASVGVTLGAFQRSSAKISDLLMTEFSAYLAC